jgi:hypothetical protein
MKTRILSLILLLCLCASFAACAGEHTHTPATEWENSDMYHWHPCTGKGCTIALSQVPHTWDKGKITQQPTKEVAGIKTYTCTVCGRTAKEPITYQQQTSVTLAEWRAALSAEAMQNVTVHVGDEIYDTTPAGVERWVIVTHQLDGEWLHYRFTVDYKPMESEDVVEDTIPNRTDYIEENGIYDVFSSASLGDLLDDFADEYHSFEYDAKDGVYRKGDITLSFEEGRLVSLEAEESWFLFEKYGKTTVKPAGA